MYFYRVKILQILIFPFSLLYGLILWVRNKLFDWGIFSQKSYDVPIISVGNLNMGGTGKTPHIEYLIRLLKSDYSIATISRGYGRKTKGYIKATLQSSCEQIGDEPKQYKQKFRDVEVIVDENRNEGIKNILSENKNVNLILLDDAYQHRSVKPGLSILLTDYHKLFSSDFMLPTGTLREFRAGYKRADIIVVTKTPKVFSPILRKTIEAEINPLPHQKLYYSYIDYCEMKEMPDIENRPEVNKTYAILFFAGIANVYPIEEHLRRQCEEFSSIKFPDHHKFSVKDIVKIRETFDNIASRNKIIITTEKDAMRMDKPELLEALKGLPVFYVPIEIVFHTIENEEFNNEITKYVRKN